MLHKNKDGKCAINNIFYILGNKCIEKVYLF